MAKLSLSSKSYNPKGYKTSTSKAMKEAGAKSSRTDSSGVTNFYSSGKDIDAGKAPISTMKNGVPVITPQSLATVPKPNTPGAPTLPDPGNMAQANNTALGSMLGDLGISTDQNGLFVTNSTPQKDNYTALYEQYLQTQMGIDQPNNEKILRDLEREAGIKQKQQEVTNYTSQLNAITANAQAEALKLEGQGRGQTSGFIGGEQARINREAAIAALPVQAQLAAAQGNLEMAQSHVDKMFAVRSQDAQARYQFKTKMVESLFDFANAQETRRLQELQRKEDRAYQEETRNMSLANEWAKTAIEYGQSSLAGRIMALDPKSKTYAQDLSKLQGQVQKPAPTPTAKAPTLQNFGTNDAPDWRQYDPTTGQWTKVAGVGGGTGVTGIDSTSKTLDQLRFLRETAKNASNLASASGPSFITRTLGDTFVGDTKFRQLEAQANTLKTNVLALTTDPSIRKYFGPQMSNADVQLIQAAGTTLNPDKQSPQQLKTEIQRLDTLFNRMQTALVSGMSAESALNGQMVTGGDGNMYVIVDE